MKRNLNENPTRSTAGCLPVPLFNQKKRNRQPLTSNPLQNDPGISNASDSYDFPPLPSDWAWEAVNPELPPLTKTVNMGQIPHSVSHPLRSENSVSKPIQSNAERSKSDWSYRDGNKNTSLKTWNKNDFKPQCKRRNLMTNNGINSSPMNLGAQQQRQLRVSESTNLPSQRESEALRQAKSSEIPGSTMRSLDKNSTLQAFKPNFQQNQFKKKMFDGFQEVNTLKKETSSYQLKLREKDNSLRIISAVIESMKYWREHAQKTVLLFEILAVLDSAVTPGRYCSKTFLMRDGKHTLPCVFYEIDRELPRLIRGRVHRCVGNYDQKKNIFKCVSVRPASASEQKTFQTFVKIVDAEMRYYTSVMNEV
ncbi:SPATA22 [Cervus elaphus hippelaphus]|uniref:SPATA22 n=1 Tax=Cervus elaphus hippelaphus TaxID=46360 RepID=A0A212D6K6_CEREH|nr:spermatogenesis-associated protein 22 [Cervus canadensis]XP_043756857.1 spermatogenesis-associated protein 22 [Cervus elaphus]OWK13880.1 SPATA22 [Cervus elaphus hippelaphus]